MRLTLSLCFLGALIGLSGCVTAPVSPAPKRADVLSVMERVADWQLAHPPKPRGEDTENPPRSAEYSPRGWVMGAADAGIMALGEISPSSRFVDAMRAMGEKNGWKPGVRVYHADDHCVIQTYAELYLRDHRPEQIAPSVQRFDSILAHPAPGGLEFVGENRNTQWSWCDALFMAPPAWVRLWKATGNAAYLDFAVTHWWKTSDYLYDQDEHLYFRDSTYFKRRESNGKKIFWSRGNGWVIGGLVRVLQWLPNDHPARARFERQFKEMAAKLITLQQPDGFWHSSLLDPEEYTSQEESGTGFYCYGLAWGVNHGLLDRATYLPAVLRAWSALNSCVQPDGRLTHVQPIGADPRKFSPDSTEPFGVGCFLLAGSEVYRLADR
jgi:rhamnogalacturonyl hydrolase YesR